MTQLDSFSRKEQVNFHNPAAEDNPTSSELIADKSRSINKDFHMVLELFEDHQNPKEEHGWVTREITHKEFAERTRKQAEILRDLKLLELGKFDLISKEILESTLKDHLQDCDIQTWLGDSTPDIAIVAKDEGKKLGLSLLDQIKKEVVDYKVLIPFSDAEFEDYLICNTSKYLPYLFETVDFLWKNEFIDQECLSNISEDEKFLRRASLYTRKYYFSKLNVMSHEYGTNITKQWFAPLGFQFIDALNAQQQARAKLQLITANMMQISNYYEFPFRSPEAQAAKEFKELLSSQRYSNYLKSGKQLSNLRYSNDLHNENLELKYL
ncbi:uncharacterized protein PGTG_02337 [Puccinia graminis f. sp. tritici CRL 75-36-700-3]|uniref:Uncharacterized protein n=1 Tax=Puccinia graminis f. sp. tritici (strain CRL 75-36-700-3 / race SCCL) TaxID=418459 RepID=E3JXV1_PUCGT|nr:uncharacterized protein PGTG_02337 [Puccinia graminis f. sp. tritici CRL 75-36-700-3]EFP76876.1 hypothetical protein PGTG_02337 [Puccinia graminis f. sp. tritici CRL 75-36-700-3]